ncbi:FmdB family zinc ribbon protein [Leekyejoonella antrihumi]|uniref:FmdB family transcriptional regulator n=1 Tax=Leekyejoonella antrihumi TaxID=1660198 RepID=A0A563E8U8_9MICO|nr:FmdB family zinc ribbon protein [Leekyejoonella antrihumi]TWP38631.1 FmdB family transcriptional regulator [Leekyejoonella antrihumi]
MPTYAYACKDCGHRFDIVQAFTDDTLSSCPECGGTLKKVWGSVGVVFKGSGFYRNDSRSTTTSSSPAAEKSGKTDSAGKSDSGKSDAGKSDAGKSDAGKSDSGKKSDSSSSKSIGSSSSSSDSGSAA